MLTRLIARLRNVRQRRAAEGEAQDEIRFHVQMATQSGIDDGLSPAEARRRALQAFGSVVAASEGVRDARATWFDGVWQDVRFGLATLRRAPGFSSLAIVVLALGVGLNTAVFSIVNAVFFQSIPVAQPDRLVYEYQILPRYRQIFITDFRVLDFLRKSDDVFSGLTAHWELPARLRVGDESVTAAGELVTANYFDVLGVQMALGRAFVPAEDRLSTTERAIVISDDLWTRFFKRRPGILGTEVRLGTHTFTVVGVAVPGFHGLSNPWSPAQWWVTAPQFYGADYVHFSTGLIGRLKPGVTLPQARAAIAVQNEQFWREQRESGSASTRTPPAVLLPIRTVRTPFNPDDEVVPLRLAVAVSVVVALVLLVAAANIAGILRARGVTRTPEIAVRRALGAGAARLVRQLVAESLALSVAGSTVGLVLARWLVGLYRAVTPDRYVVAVPLDWRVVAFTLVACVSIGVLIGLAPAVQSLRVNVVAALGSGAAATRPTRARLRHAVVIPQVAVSLLLLLVAGVHVRALAGIELTPVGLDLGRTAMLDVGLVEDDSRPFGPTPPDLEARRAARSRAFLQALLERLQNMPELGSLALADGSPIEDHQGTPPSFIGERAFAAGDRTGAGAYRLGVSGGYFEAVGTPVRAGRDFDARDVRESPSVAIISQAVATQLWPGQSPLGKRLTAYNSSLVSPQVNWLTVVGVVADVHPILRPDVVTPMVYVPLTQQWRPSVSRLIAHTAQMPPALVASLTATVRAADPRADVARARFLSDIAGEMLYPRRVAATILTASGLIGLLLAAVGLYAVVSQSIAQRTRELSIRMAIGANRWTITALVLREGLVVTAFGAAIGVPLALAALTMTATLVGPLPVRDPIAFAAATILVAATTMLACYGPARRAAGADLAATLRSL
jgi:putative ABC transport system permease protein